MHVCSCMFIYVTVRRTYDPTFGYRVAALLIGLIVVEERITTTTSRHLKQIIT